MSGNTKRDDLNDVSQHEHLYRLSKFLAKSTAGVLAPVGLSSIATELFDLVVSDPAAKRRDKFLIDIAVRVENLEADGLISLEGLLNNEEAAALLFRAVQAAMRSSGERKLLALREAALKGILGCGAGKISPAQIVIGLVDRMTDYHIILLFWKNSPPKSYTLGEVRAEDGDEARRSHFFGQPVFTDHTQLEDPIRVFSYMDWGLYVEKDDKVSFNLAHADLVTMGLLDPVLGTEQYLEGRVAKMRTTPEVVGHQISELGAYVCKFIQFDADST